jgi:hypothetical protein
MSNDYFNFGSALIDHTKARTSAINDLFTAIAAGFALLPSLATFNVNLFGYCTDASAGANTVALTSGHSLGSYTLGAMFRWQAAYANTGPVTVNVDGLGAKALKRGNGDPLVSGDIPVSSIPMIVYDGTNMVLLSAPVNDIAAAAASATVAASSASAAASSASAASASASAASSSASSASSSASSAAGAVTTHAALTATHGATGAIMGTTNTPSFTVTADGTISFASGSYISTGHSGARSQMKSPSNGVIFEWGPANDEMYVPNHGTTASAANCFIDSSTGQIKRSTSSARAKTDIEAIVAPEKTLDLSGKFFRSVLPGDDPTKSFYGFIAEEVAAVDPRFALWGTEVIGQLDDIVEIKTVVDGKETVERRPVQIPIYSEERPVGISYPAIIAHLVETVKQLEQRVAALEAR